MIKLAEVPPMRHFDGLARSLIHGIHRDKRVTRSLDNIAVMHSTQYVLKG
jgi:hypothetical protein